MNVGPTFINGFYDEGLGDLGQWTTTVGKVGQAAGATGAVIGGVSTLTGIGAGAALGSVVPIVGTIIGALAGIIGGIFGAHQQKVAVENKVSGQWAASGPQTINQVVSAWQTGQIDSGTASSALDSIYQQFLQMNAPITKYQGTTGSFPDPTQARPSSNCNWACGTSYDLYQEIQGLKGQIGGAPVGASLGLGSLMSSPLLLIGGAALLLLLLKK
jgi:hypothetical protein